MPADPAAEPRPALNVLKYWPPVLLMIAAMYWASTDLFSDGNTRSIIERIGLSLHPRAQEAMLLALNYLVRKLAHFAEYALLAALLFRARRGDRGARWRWRWAAYTFSLACGWALLDEFHQAFTRTRGSSIYDSMLDAAGALVMLTAIALFYARKSPEPRRAASQT